MSVNSSSTFTPPLDFHCDHIVVHIRTVKTILLLPLCTFIVYLGLQRWRQRRSFQSHSDLFTYHLAVLELIWVFGFFSVCSNVFPFYQIGFCATHLGFYAEIMFHVLTCVERYLAVVHPVTYLGLKTSRGLRIRRILIVGVWLLSSGLTCLIFGDVSLSAFLPLLSLLVVSIVATSFCSLSVLCVLIRPPPGGGGEERVDQSKRRAFHTITVIWSVLCLWFIALLSNVLVEQSAVPHHTIRCLTKALVNWINLLCSLELPIMYLHRAGKLPCCCCSKL